MASAGKGARDKGSNFERKIAQHMSDWWGGNFTRTPGSGGLRWGSDQRIAGDIVPPAGMDFPFVIECKKQEGYTLDNFLFSTGTPVKWWEQVVTDSRRLSLDKTQEQKTPLLIFSKNRAKVMVALPYTSSMYNLLAVASNGALLTTPITIKNIRDEEQDFNLIITTLDALMKLPLDTMRDYGKTVKWDAYQEE